MKVVNKLVISAFPTSPINAVIQNDNDDTIFKKKFWTPSFEKEIIKILDEHVEIEEIYIFGSKKYVGHLSDTVRNLTDLPVFEEGI